MNNKEQNTHYYDLVMKNYMTIRIKKVLKGLFVGSLGGLSASGVSFGIAYGVIHDQSQNKFFEDNFEDNVGKGKYQNCSVVSGVRKVHMTCRPPSLHKEFNNEEELFVKNNLDAFLGFAPYIVTGITVAGILLSVTYASLSPNPEYKSEQSEVLEQPALQVVVEAPEHRNLLSTLSFLKTSPPKVDNSEENRLALSSPLLSPTRSASS